MNPPSLIGLLTELLPLVYTPDAPADQTLKRLFAARRFLGARDRRFLTATVFGILRHAKLIEFLLGSCPFLSVHDAGNMPRWHSLLYYATYAVRITGQDRVQAGRDMSAQWADALKGVDPDATLHWLQQAEIPAEVRGQADRYLSIMYSLPEFAVQQWIRRYGPEAEALCAALNTQAPLTVRVNTLQGDVRSCQDTLKQEGVDTVRAALAPEGLHLGKRLHLESLRSFRTGMFEMQDEGSQIISHLVDPRPGETIVDACAGTGGKALHMAALMENRGRIYALEPDARRLRRTAERSHRAGIAIMQTLAPSEPAVQSLRNGADKVLVDAPCSGSGVFRRNPWAKLFLSKDQVDRYRERQKSILRTYAPLVRVGGALVYATCSLLTEENEEVISDFLQHHPSFEVIPARRVLESAGKAVDGAGTYLALLPHRHSCDGFFGAVMVRR